MKLNRRGFTLIELIVVISIIAILVGLGVPKFLGYTKEAQRTKHLTFVKELESASERYCMRSNDWPRLTNVPYTAVELEEYSSEYFDLTGEKVVLDPNGNYYNIDYDKLSKYVKKT